MRLIFLCTTKPSQVLIVGAVLAVRLTETQIAVEDLELLFPMKF
jgi:hypothetical protein